MSELRSVIDGFRAEVLAELPEARLEEDFAELQRGVEQLEVERLCRLAEIERDHQFAVVEPDQRRMPCVNRAEMRLRIAIDQAGGTAFDQAMISRIGWP